MAQYMDVRGGNERQKRLAAWIQEQNRRRGGGVAGMASAGGAGNPIGAARQRVPIPRLTQMGGMLRGLLMQQGLGRGQGIPSLGFTAGPFESSPGRGMPVPEFIRGTPPSLGQLPPGIPTPQAEAPGPTQVASASAYTEPPISATDPGSVFGGVNEPGGTISATGPGSTTGGVNQPGGTISATGPGSATGGVNEPGGVISATGPGSVWDAGAPATSSDLIQIGPGIWYNASTGKLFGVGNRSAMAQ